jgi:Xaa-Pro aminopeptidase
MADQAAYDMDEFHDKENRIRSLLQAHQLDALLLQRVGSFAWATCGAASYVNTAATWGEASLLFTLSGRYLVTNNIEAPRLQQEAGLGAQGWEFRISPWHGPADALDILTRGMRLGADGPYPGAVDLSASLARLRANLTPAEGERFRLLGRLCAEAMDAAVRLVYPGQTELQIAGQLACEAEKRGVQAIVNLAAADERVFAFRHPLPTARQLEHYAMLVLCGRRWGLVCSLSRLVHFGRLPDDLRRKSEAVAQVDAAFIASTRPGQTLGDVWQRATDAYARAGFAGEWQYHHQGGPAGYEPREYLAMPGSVDLVIEGQAYAWNPTIAGTKSEDTILVGRQDSDVLTAIDGWPVLQAAYGDHEYARPAILEVL